MEANDAFEKDEEVDSDMALALELDAAENSRPKSQADSPSEQHRSPSPSTSVLPTPASSPTIPHTPAIHHTHSISHIKRAKQNTLTKKKAKKKKAKKAIAPAPPTQPSLRQPPLPQPAPIIDDPAESMESGAYSDDSASVSPPDLAEAGPSDTSHPYPFCSPNNGGVQALDGWFHSSSLLSVAPGCVIPAPCAFNPTLEVTGYPKTVTFDSLKQPSTSVTTTTKESQPEPPPIVPTTDFQTVTYRLPFIDRKFLSLPKWHCIPRPQYKAACGVSSLTAVFNYLYSVFGIGTLPPLSTEQVMAILGYRPPFDQISFGRFTGNDTLMRWFMKLVNYFGVKGHCEYLWKAYGKNKTPGINRDSALVAVKEAVRNDNEMLIYHWFPSSSFFFFHYFFLFISLSIIHSLCKSIQPSSLHLIFLNSQSQSLHLHYRL